MLSSHADPLYLEVYAVVTDNPSPKRQTSEATAAANQDQREGRLRVGVGRAMAHHGEILQGVFEGEDGRLRRGLITLPMAAKHSTVTFWPTEEDGVRVRPAGRRKAAKAAALALLYLGVGDTGGELTVESEISIGHGFGSSTADVIAAIRAVADAAARQLRCSTVARLAVEAERASDAIAFGDQAVLFAHREGRVIEDFGGEYPPLFVVGIRVGGTRPIDTLNLPRALYDKQEICQFRILRALASRAIRQQDPRLLGNVASASARISQRHLAKPRFGEIMEIAQMHGACGVQVAHSGTLMGVLFDAQQSGVSSRVRAAVTVLQRAEFEGIVTFGVSAEGAMPI